MHPKWIIIFKVYLMHILFTAYCISGVCWALGIQM